MILCACDARRNQIISNILVSPTATETPAPPTATPTITPSPTATLTPTPVIEVNNLDLLIFGEYDQADHDIREQIDVSADPVEILRGQTDLIESSYASGDYQQCMDTMEDFRETLTGTDLRPNALLSKAYYLNAQCAAELELYKADRKSVV